MLRQFPTSNCYYVLLMHSSRFKFNKIKLLALEVAKLFSSFANCTVWHVFSSHHEYSACHCVPSLPFSHSAPEMYESSCIHSSVTLSYTTHILTKRFSFVSFVFSLRDFWIVTPCSLASVCRFRGTSASGFGIEGNGFCFVRFVFAGVCLKIIISRPMPPCILVDFCRLSFESTAFIFREVWKMDSILWDLMFSQR